jgi:glutamate--cysteine ligase
MSQPLDFGPLGIDPLAHPLKTIDQLETLFHSAKKSHGEELIGIEYEFFAHDLVHNMPLPYEGDISITSLFLALKEKYPDRYEPVFEDQNVVAVNSKKAVIALEPGGQIEIAVAPFKDPVVANDALKSVYSDLKSCADEQKIAFFSMGLHPTAARDEMAFVKKKRYAIMRTEMATREDLGRDMMLRSCALQLNLDYNNESDMAHKLRFAFALMPMYSALASNSPFFDQKASTKALPRSDVWQHTDKRRTGVPAIIFEKNFSYMHWINFALDVPMYFIRRNNNYIDARGFSFREFMSTGFQGEKACLRDFVDHLSTIFTEVRLKPFIELRSPDSVPLNFVRALSVFTCALFYDQNAFNKAEAFFSDITAHELEELRIKSIIDGHKTSFRGRTLFALAQDLLDIVKSSVRSHMPAAENSLKPLSMLLEANSTLAEWAKKKFTSVSKESVPELTKVFSPSAEILV